jgi:hypothetical protein
MIKKSKYFKKSIIVFIALILVGLVGFLGMNGSAQAQNTGANKNCEAGVDWCDSKDCSVAKCPDGSYKLQVGIPGIANSCKFKTTYYDDKAEPVYEIKTLYCVKGFPAYVRAIYNFSIGVIGILAVVMIMLGGFRWLLAAGNAQKIAGAKTIIISAIMGMVLVLASYSILYIANPVIKDLDLVVAPLDKFKEGESLGWCNQNMDIAGKNTIPILGIDKKDGPQCGKKYLLKDQLNGEDVFCVGFRCNKAYGLPVDPACIDHGSSFQCNKVPNNIGIIDNKDFGYGTRNWKYTDDYFLIETMKCGKLYVDKGDKDVDDNKNIFWHGADCGSDGYCAIRAESGVDFTKPWVEVSVDGGTNQEVGKFIDAWCCRFKNENDYSCTKK